MFRREWRQPEALQYHDNIRSAERYPGGDGNFKEQGPNTKYNWKQDRVDFQRMRPLTIPPPEKRGKSCEERDFEHEELTREQRAEENYKKSKKKIYDSENDEWTARFCRYLGYLIGVTSDKLMICWH